MWIFPTDFYKRQHKQISTKINPEGAELIYAEGHTDRQKGMLDETKRQFSR
jgi:hypothetical protein